MINYTVNLKIESVIRSKSRMEIWQIQETAPLERLPIWPYGLCQREPKVPGLYKKHTAAQPVTVCPRYHVARTSERLFDRQTP